MDHIFEKINNLVFEDIGHNQYGILIDSFLMRHPMITQELLPAIAKARMDRAYQQKFAQLNWSDKASIEDRMGGLLELLREAYRSIHGCYDNEYVSEENRISLEEARILFDAYKAQKLKNGILNSIREAYRSISIDIDKEDQQFSKYQLISTNRFISIICDKDTQALFDSRLNKYMRIEVPWCLLTSMELLISKGFIGKIAFKVCEIEEQRRLNEDMARGAKLELNLTNLPKISQFYSRQNLDNKLWIKHDMNKGSLTFEELVGDFVLEENEVVTQVIHLEYESVSDGYVIKHLDQEYIYYSCDAYEKRELNPNIKGERKVKTFKMDDSKIPFTYKIDGEFFLFQVLDAFLKNKDLIEEYFEDMKA